MEHVAMPSRYHSDKYLSFIELQAKLGGRGRTSIYRDFGPGGWLPKPIKIGGRLYWPEADVDAAISALAETAS